MRMRVADYIANALAEFGIHEVFMVTGGGAMHLDDAFGHSNKLHCTYNHHEQACAMAAEAYARVSNKIAAVCVTTGPGATNAMTGCLCGWMGSIPMLIISGQARYDTTVYASGLDLRTRGIQEFDIIEAVRSMTKYCSIVKSVGEIRYKLEKALYLATHGRPGPCWLDIPLNIQGGVTDDANLKGYIPPQEVIPNLKSTAQCILQHIRSAQRPILFAGNGIRLAGAHEMFLKLVEMLNIPVVTGMSSVDAISSNHPLFAGRSGMTGERAGNFAVQNCDLLISLGSRLSFAQTGFDTANWARGAYKILNDIDQEELKKKELCGDLTVCCDVKALIQALLGEQEKPLEAKRNWINQCAQWRREYPVVLPKHYKDTKPNIYVFFQELTKRLSKKHLLIVSVGTSRVAGSQASIIKEGMRFITNPSTASMGYDLPAAIGAAVAAKERPIVLVTGDGSLQMNIQELQTIIHHRYPISIFVINNLGYQSIRMTQRNYFSENLIGVGADSGDLSFPDLRKIADAYGFLFQRCSESKGLEKIIEWGLSQKEPNISEILVSINQTIEPKVTSRKGPNGEMFSSVLEDMAPFLERGELEKNMYIPLADTKR